MIGERYSKTLAGCTHARAAGRRSAAASGNQKTPLCYQRRLTRKRRTLAAGRTLVTSKPWPITSAQPAFASKPAATAVQGSGLGLLQTGREDGLEMRALFFARDDGDFDVLEAGFFEPLVQLHFAEA